MPEQPEFDADDALNRVLQAVLPFRAAANRAETPEQLVAVTNLGLGAALNAVGEPLTQQHLTSLLFAAVVRLADVWNSENQDVTIPDTPEELQ